LEIVQRESFVSILQVEDEVLFSFAEAIPSFRDYGHCLDVIKQETKGTEY